MSKFLYFLKAHRKDVLFISVLIAVVIFFGFVQKHSTKPTGNAASTAPTSEVSAVPDASPTPDASMVPEQNYNPNEEPSSGLEIATDISVTVNGDKDEDVEAILNELLTKNGDFAPGDSWDVRPLADYAQIDPKYANLSAFTVQTEYVRTADIQIGDTTIHHAVGDPAYCIAFAEKKDDGTYVIHRFVADGQYLVEDYYVPGGADSL